ncbi:MAG: hypothetical protein FWE14_06780 [Lachnospiraceae bacterium]|nr:hypothetical protein [Lachnospiraceae bacterium]
MELLLWLLVLFVIFVSLRMIYRTYKRRKSENLDFDHFESKTQYKRRLNPDKTGRRAENDFVTKYNSPVDYRDPVIAKDEENYDDWGI